MYMYCHLLVNSNHISPVRIYVQFNRTVCCPEFDFYSEETYDATILNEPRREKTCLRDSDSGFSTKSDANRNLQPQKKAMFLKCWIYVEEELCYPCGV